MSNAMILCTQLPLRTDLSMAVKDFVNLGDTSTGVEKTLCVRTVGPSYVEAGVETQKGNAKCALGGVFFGRKLFGNQWKANRVRASRTHNAGAFRLGTNFYCIAQEIDSQHVSYKGNVL
jgi:hypothetical protein